MCGQKGLWVGGRQGAEPGRPARPGARQPPPAPVRQLPALGEARGRLAVQLGVLLRRRGAMDGQGADVS